MDFFQPLKNHQHNHHHRIAAFGIALWFSYLHFLQKNTFTWNRAAFGKWFASTRWLTHTQPKRARFRRLFGKRGSFADSINANDVKTQQYTDNLEIDVCMRFSVCIVFSTQNRVYVLYFLLVYWRRREHSIWIIKHFHAMRAAVLEKHNNIIHIINREKKQFIKIMDLDLVNK